MLRESTPASAFPVWLEERKLEKAALLQDIHKPLRRNLARPFISTKYVLEKLESRNVFNPKCL